MFERLLVPLDRTSFAEETIPIAMLIPSRRVRLLHVEPGARVTAADRGDAAAVASPRAGAAGATPDPAIGYLGTWGEEFWRQGRAVEVAVTRGDPADRIVESSGDADLIVMATHAPDVLRRALRGSVTDRVARGAATPTLLVRGGRRTSRIEPVRIVVPLDGSSLAEEALPVAARLGDALGLPLHLIRVVNRATILFAPEVLFKEADDYLASLVRLLAGRGLDATYDVRFGAVAASLRDTIEPNDLVVMATRGRGGLRRWLLGSVAEQLVRSGPVPVILVPDAQRHAPEKPGYAAALGEFRHNN